jgi:hypothetical protein
MLEELLEDKLHPIFQRLPIYLFLKSLEVQLRDAITTPLLLLGL